jgi:hypothetical protein
MKGAQRTKSPKPTGNQIRTRITANHEKRLTIAKAMKAEVGVTEHAINTENLDGLAYFDTGEIISPEGRNMRELHTLAHECGPLRVTGRP